VLIAEVLQGFPEQLSPARKTLLETTLTEGGELIIEDRKHK
jgi:hypothetical protein